jgi:hypothetical protein
LEKAILPMNETEAENDVEPIAGGKSGHAQIVPFDHRGCPKSGDAKLSVKVGQAGAQQPNR